jgi:uncharacterized protein YidB (DUF937 family)
MGLLDQVIDAASSLFGQHGKESALFGAIMQLINNPQTGGLAGVIQSFELAGLGDVVKSWVSSGVNLPITATQIQSVFGNEQIRNFASQAGMDPDQAAGKLAEYLPQVIDKMTPDGSVPAPGALTEQGLESLKHKVFG